jgi:hypothetical protein
MDASTVLVEFVTQHGPYKTCERLRCTPEAARTLCDCVPPTAVRVSEDPVPETNRAVLDDVRSDHVVNKAAGRKRKGWKR